MKGTVTTVVGGVLSTVTKRISKGTGGLEN